MCQSTQIYILKRICKTVKKHQLLICVFCLQITLWDMRVFVPVMSSMLKLPLFRDSGSLEILQQLKHIFQKKQNSKKNTLQPQQRHKTVSIHPWSRCKYPVVTLNTTASILFYYPAHGNTHKHWEDGQCIRLWMLFFITQPQGRSRNKVCVCVCAFITALKCSIGYKREHDVSRPSETNVNVQIKACLCCVCEYLL